MRLTPKNAPREQHPSGAEWAWADTAPQASRFSLPFSTLSPSTNSRFERCEIVKTSMKVEWNVCPQWPVHHPTT